MAFLTGPGTEGKAIQARRIQGPVALSGFYCGGDTKMRVALHIPLVFLILFHLLTAQGYAAALTDQIGRSVSVPDDPKRIISFTPGLTEMVFELGRQARLVGVTRESKLPDDRQLPDVGTYINLDLERIVALKPDLCLAGRDGNPKSVVDRLEAMGIAVYVFDPRSLEEIMDAVTRLGGILHAESKAVEQVEMMRKRIRQVDIRVEQARARPRVFFQIDAAEIVSAGSNTFIDQLITRAGGINLCCGRAALSPLFLGEYPGNATRNRAHNHHGGRF